MGQKWRILKKLRFRSLSTSSSDVDSQRSHSTNENVIEESESSSDVDSQRSHSTNENVIEESEILRPNMDNQQSRNANVNVLEEIIGPNIISNHDFSDELRSWEPNCCYGYVASGQPGDQLEGVKPKSGTYYAVVSKRKDYWQGLEQDITSKVSAYFTYTLSAYVRVWGGDRQPSKVEATLRLLYPNEATKYKNVGCRTMVSKDRWEKLDGEFLLRSIPKQVVLYFEGPPPGVDLLIDSVIVSCPSLKNSEENTAAKIILNHDFSDSLHPWWPMGCCGYLASVESGLIRGVKANSGKYYAVASKRTESHHGLKRDITKIVSTGSTYTLSAYVRVWGDIQQHTTVEATLKLKYKETTNYKYKSVRRIMVSKDEWQKLEGEFSFESMPDEVMLLMVGPPSGVDLLLDSVTISCSCLDKTQMATSQKIREQAEEVKGQAQEKKEDMKNQASDSMQHKASASTQSAQEKYESGKDRTGTFLQQPGEQVKNMAQGAADAVKNTLGMGDNNPISKQ